MQEATFGRGHDYTIGSPHLKHRHLQDRLQSVVRESLEDIRARGLPLTVLEIGAGHGGYTEPLLAYGCHVTATETSRPAMETLTRKFGNNPQFVAVFAHNGGLEALAGKRFSLVLFSSVLHHIPDYISFISEACEGNLLSGGALVSVQDPLWYESMRRSTYYLSKGSYFVWRITRGDYLRGARTRLRRMRGRYDVNNPADMVEYHAVRRGVNEEEVTSLLEGKFESVRLTRYWSCIPRLFQSIGEVARQHNTFAIQAEGYRG